MAVVVGWQHGPDDDEDVAGPVEADLPCPDPEDLHDPAQLPPGWVLAAADPAALPGQWVDAGMSAWFSHTNRAALALARWLLETSRAQPGTRERVPDRARAGKIVAASLGWSQTYAAARVEFARQVLERLPALGEAMATGVLEEHKAAIFTTTLAELDTTQARTVVERVLPAAPRLAFQALRRRIEQAAEALDPDWAAARRAAAITRRRVSFAIAPSGAAELCGLDLPEEPAQDAHDRIVALGRAVAKRLRAAGLDAPVGPIESEVMLTLTGPDGAGLWDHDVVEHVVTRFGGPAGDDTDPEDGPDGPNDLDGPDADGPGDGGRVDDLEHGSPHHNSSGDNSSGDNSSGDNSSGDSSSDNNSSCGDSSCGDDSADDREGTVLRGAHRQEPAAGEAPAPWRASFTPRVVLRVGLRTLLGLDRRPGEIPGRGTVVSHVAVSMAWARTHSTWRLLLYDRDGALEYVLTIHPPRSGRPVPHAQQRRHHLIEVTAFTEELEALHHTLATDQPGADQPALDLPGLDPPAATPLRDALVPGDALGLLERAARALTRARARPADQHPANTRAEAGNRFPSAALRAWVQARDRTCRSSGCHADAVGCDIDHTTAVTDGGRTIASDLGAVCRRDHRFKHDPDSGWTVHQPSPGRFEWTAPTGRLHVVEPEPYDPLPDPVPRTEDDADSLPGVPLHPPGPPPPPGQPRRNRHGHLTDAALATTDRLRRRALDRANGESDDPAPSPDQACDDRRPEEPPF